MTSPPAALPGGRPSPRPRRVLLYTHNSIGLGHAVRCLALITGMRRHRPELDFLVLTGSTLPQLFLNEGVEVLRLPGLRQELRAGGPELVPRHLRACSALELAGLRRGVILAAARGFAPDVVMVEHYPAGLLGEALPLLGLGPEAMPRRDYALVHLGRGQPRQPAWPQVALPALEDLLAAYDLRYVLDHPPPGQAEGGGRHGAVHLGPVASRPRRELAPRRETLAGLGLEERGMVLLCLGRGGPVEEMARCLLEALPRAGLGGRGAVLVLDPYLGPAAAERLRGLAREAGALVPPFAPYLVEAVAAADLVVCRGGYNAVAELLMTGVPALVIPERHPSGEQERRCRALPPEQALVATEEEVVAGDAAGLLARAAALGPGPGSDGYDKYAVGARLVEDLEAWFAARAGREER